MLPLALLSEVSPLPSRSAPLAVVKEREEGGEVWRGDALSWRPRRCLPLQEMERCHDEITGALPSSVRSPLVHGVCVSEGE